MKAVSAVLIDYELNVLVPAILNLKTMEVQRVESVLDSVGGLNFTKVGIYIYDSQSPFKVYDIKLNPKTHAWAITNLTAKKALLDRTKGNRLNTKTISEFASTFEEKTKLEKAIAPVYKPKNTAKQKI